MPPPAPTEVSTAAPDSSIYDKQLAWKLHGQRKLASKSQELRAQQEQQCTFAPKTNSKLQRSLDDSGLDEEEDGEEKVTTAETEAALLHPTESQESSIQLHLARQGRAREHAREAQHKLNGAQQAKDFTKVTTFEPFTLSTTNWKPRQSTTESPTKVDNNQQQSKSTSKGSGNPKTKAQPAASRKSNKSPHSPPCATKEETWESERATLISVIDAQQRELALREQAQQEAVRVAERFAEATQAFEERLVAVEQTVGKELEEVKKLLASQAASTDLILTSLGITRRPDSTTGSSLYD